MRRKNVPGSYVANLKNKAEALEVIISDLKAKISPVDGGPSLTPFSLASSMLMRVFNARESAWRSVCSGASALREDWGFQQDWKSTPHWACPNPKCRFQRTISNSGETEIPYSAVQEAHGIRYRSSFLIKCHVELPKSNEGLGFKCIFCHQSTLNYYPTEQDLIRHVLFHEGKKPSPTVEDKISCISGRFAMDAEAFDINLTLPFDSVIPMTGGDSARSTESWVMTPETVAAHSSAQLGTEVKHRSPKRLKSHKNKSKSGPQVDDSGDHIGRAKTEDVVKELPYLSDRSEMDLTPAETNRSPLLEDPSSTRSTDDGIDDSHPNQPKDAKFNAQIDERFLVAKAVTKGTTGEFERGKKSSILSLTSPHTSQAVLPQTASLQSEEEASSPTDTNNTETNLESLRASDSQSTCDHLENHLSYPEWEGFAAVDMNSDTFMEEVNPRWSMASNTMETGASELSDNYSDSDRSSHYSRGSTDMSTVGSISSSRSSSTSRDLTVNPSVVPLVIESPKKPTCWDHGCNGRQFSTFSNLLRHQREHAGIPLRSVCPGCGAEFTRETARDRHLQHDMCKAKRPKTRLPLPFENPELADSQGQEGGLKEVSMAGDNNPTLDTGIVDPKYTEAIGEIPHLLQYLHGVRVLRNEEHGFGTSIKCYIEHLTNQSWDWWPLKPLYRPLKSDEVRIQWSCVSIYPVFG